MSVQFQNAQSAIIRSIRQVSLYREWQQLRGGKRLPDIGAFVPDARSGDADDLYVSRIEKADGRLNYRCDRAGANIQRAFGRAMQGNNLESCLDSGIARAIKPIWDACISRQLPAYSIVPTFDRKGVPVTLEHLHLPFAGVNDSPTHMLSSLHAVSEEGRFEREGVVQLNTSTVPLHWAVIIDPNAVPLVPTLSDLAEDVVAL